MAINLLRFRIQAWLVLYFCMAGLTAFAGGKNNGHSLPFKTSDLFDHHVFIENKGQFNGKVPGNTPVLYYAKAGQMKVYFTASGICYSYEEVKLLDEAERDKLEEKSGKKGESEKQRASSSVMHYMQGLWVGANPTPTVLTEGSTSYYFTYPEGANKTIIAHGYTKITYKDLYPNIDVEYILPADKGGIKYSLILHPGADLSLVKMNYSGNGLSLNSTGDLLIPFQPGDFTDHAPVTFYQSDKTPLHSSYSLNKSEISFQILGGYDHTRTVVVDPWTTDPLFASYDSGYDVDFDNLGNVYVYGSYNPYVLEKFTSAGALIWSYNATPISGIYYGDMCTDEVSSAAYIVEGYNTSGSGAQVIKVKPNGTQGPIFPGNAGEDEFWRCDYDPCSRQIVIGAGGTSGQHQTAMLDTNMITINPVNSIGTVDNGYHDITLLCTDPAGGFCYMATTKSLAGYPAFDNSLFKAPMPALAPAVFVVADGYTIPEFTGFTYVNGTTGYNGFNGLACSLNFVYTYDGATVKKWNKTTGAFIAQVATGGTARNSGGLAVDLCDNIYAGTGNVVKVYNVALTQTGTLAVPNTVYDVRLGVNNTLLTTGIGFVESFDLAVVTTLNVTIASTPSGCSCIGTANATTTLCGNPTAVTYSWSPGGATTANLSNLCAGTYTVTATPGCALKPVSASVVITGSVGTLTLTSTQTNNVCHGGTAGTATVTATGTAPYTYTWTPSGGGAATATGLAAGTYTCTVNDAGGCTSLQTVTITEPAAMTLTPSTTPTSCTAATGTATVGVAGGTGPYGYVWTPSGGNAATASGLNAGTYTCTVTDANNCVQASTGIVVSTGGVVISVPTQTNVSCNGGNNGSANSAIVGGTGPFTYTWTPSGGAGPNATGLTAGLYTVTVNDASGCVSSATVTITEPAVLAATNTQVNVTCNGGTNGSSTVTPTGGTAAYTYAWTPSGGAGATGTPLSAGVYNCTVTDANGCTITSVVTITQPPALTATTASTNILCNGGANGTATVTAAGGTGAYTYAWTPAGGAGPGATGLGPATYTCTITDANGCVIAPTMTVTQPALLTSTSSMTPAPCGSATGTATAAPAGGTGAYTYSWNPGAQLTQTASGLLAGNYTCTVTDANNCTCTTIVNVLGTTGQTAVAGPVVNPTCFGGTNGSATVVVTGGTAPITYAWTPAGGNAITANNLAAGAYVCTITDANGCVVTVPITLTQPAAVVPVITAHTDVSCFGGADGTATATATGGTGAYTWAWNPAAGATPTPTGLSAGVYNLTVTDANGCTGTTSVTIAQPPVLTVTAAGVATHCNAGCDGVLICIPAGGSPAYTYAWNTGCASASCNNVCAGTYTVTITDINGCTAQAISTVTQPPPINLVMTSHAAYCNQADGWAAVAATGGTGAFSYIWLPAAPGSATNSYNFIPPGTYTVHLHDANGCVDSNTVVVQNIAGVTASIPAHVDATCFGGFNGSATALATAGTPPYTYTWSPLPGGGQGTTNATGLTAGTWSCTIKDSAGCTNTATVVIGQPTPVVVTPMPALTLCIGQCFPLSATGSGGSPGYTYAWTLNGFPAASPACPIITTTYTVIATDINTCVSQPAMVTITVNPPLEVVVMPANPICPGVADTLHAIATGGSGVYFYNWMPPAGLSSTNIVNPLATPVTATTYTVIVTDNCGTPSDSATVLVNVNPAPIVTFLASDTAGCSPLCATFTSISVPGCASATWIFGDGSTGTGCTGVSHCYNTPGVYSVTEHIIDVNGCPGTMVRTNYMDAWPDPEAAFSLSPQPTSIVASEITFTDLSTGAVSWSWNFGDFANSTSTLQNPQYTYPDTGCFTATLIVKNNFGCLDTAKQPVCIQPYFTFYAPNTFTPNGDGKNETWFPQGVGIDPTRYHLMMFDRWGNLMWETHTWGDGWDGRANNGANIAQIDTYVWRCDLYDYLGNKHRFIGHCNIIQ